MKSRYPLRRRMGSGSGPMQVRMPNLQPSSPRLAVAWSTPFNTSSKLIPNVSSTVPIGLFDFHGLFVLFFMLPIILCTRFLPKHPALSLPNEYREDFV